MNIIPIKFYNNYLPNRVQNRKATAFSGGYKDIKNPQDRAYFDYSINKIIKKIQRHFFVKEKDVVVNGKVAKLSSHKDREFTLVSEDGAIKAFMKVGTVNEKNPNHYDREYSKGKDGFFIKLIASKGKGAGTFLVKEAVKLSKAKGFGGRVTLYACPIGGGGGNPIPFYYKMGFRSSVEAEQKKIERAMEEYDKTGIYEGPIIANMNLDESYIEKYLES